MAAWFDENYYLKTKLAQLEHVGEKDASGKAYTLGTLKQAIADAGMTPESHYLSCGRQEKLNPNPYFNESEYLQAKLAQLDSVNARDVNGKAYTLETLVQAIDSIGMNAAEHYETYGSKETTQDGHLLNPSNAFDSNAYVAAKLVELQKGPDAAIWKDKTPADVVKAIADAGMSPVTHYESYGAQEAGNAGVALVQTVPSEQRVPNDPARATVTGEIVPTNYNPPSLAPDKAVATPVAKPADVGSLAPETVSPPVTVPAHPALVPGDAGYVAPPAGLVDTPGKPVIPPTSTGTGNATDNWITVDSDGSGTVTKPDGTPGGTLPPGTIDTTPDDGGDIVIPPVKPDPIDPPVNPGGGGGTVIPPAANPLTGTFATNGKLSLATSSELTGTHTLVLDAGTLTDTASGVATKTWAGVKELDLTGVQTAQDDKTPLITDLTKVENTFTKFTGMNGTENGNTGIFSGNDFIKVNTAQVTTGGNLVNKIDAQGGDDVLRISDSISGAITFGKVTDIETIISTYSATSAAAINVTSVTPNATEDLTLVLMGKNGATLADGRDITLTGGHELELLNLKVAKVTLATAVDSVNNVESATLALHNSQVGSENQGVVLSDSTNNNKPDTVDLMLSDINEVYFAKNDDLKVVSIDNYDSWSAGDFTHTLVGGVEARSQVDLTAQTTDTQVNIENTFSGNIMVTTGSGNDTLRAEPGSNVIRTLYGGGGADWMIGGDGEDYLSGTTPGGSRGNGPQEKEDIITSTNAEVLRVFNGGKTVTEVNWLGSETLGVIQNANLLEGRGGKDQLVGSAAKDVFLYQTGGRATGREPELTFSQLGTDIIYNFDKTEDKLLIMDQDSWNTDGTTGTDTFGARNFSAGWTFADGKVTIKGAGGVQNAQLDYAVGTTAATAIGNTDKEIYIQITDSKLNNGQKDAFITIHASVLAGTENAQTAPLIICVAGVDWAVGNATENAALLDAIF